MKKLITIIILISLMLTSIIQYIQDTLISLTGRVYKRNVNEFSSASRKNNNNLVNTKLGREYKGKRKSQITSECCEDIDIRKILNNSKHPVRRMRKILLVLYKTNKIMYNNTPNDDNVNVNDYDIQIDADYYNHDYDDVDFMNHQENETSQTDILFE